MDLKFRNPGYDYMISSIMEHQTDDATPYWNEALFYFHKNLNKEYAYSLPLNERRAYFHRELKGVYEANSEIIEKKVLDYQAHWDKHREQIVAALSEAFGIDCGGILNDLVCNITLNPVCPRYLLERRFDMFYLNSPAGAIGISIHELIHYVWFAVWHDLFGDAYEEYETPSLKWILSELVVESVMDDERLSAINPYYLRGDHGGGCIYSYFYSMVLDGKPVTQTMRELYAAMHIHTFMKESYAYLQKHEPAIRAHIQKSEEEWS